IECFVVEDEKTYAVCSDGKRYLVRKRLYELEKDLPGGFERISKSALANWKTISRFSVQLSGAVDAVFKSGYVECISRRCFAELKRRYGL
ncbi:MAG: LytTR family transcriptional regulator, partial [Clostridia bacterium]|nr:LytTR family transcriptional regulator [Clostridia bacterium]